MTKASGHFDLHITGLDFDELKKIGDALNDDGTVGTSNDSSLMQTVREAGYQAGSEAGYEAGKSAAWDADAAHTAGHEDGWNGALDFAQEQLIEHFDTLVATYGKAEDADEGSGKSAVLELIAQAADEAKR